MTRLSDYDLDVMLALQLTVAWAGETGRLGWWGTDFFDPAGGGDFLARLMPHTAPWATLKLVRLAARVVDQRARKRIADADDALTLFHFGFDVDEQLDDRLEQHRKALRVPSEVFGPWFLGGIPWSLERLTTVLSVGGAPAFEVTPSGRMLSFSATPRRAAALLAAALMPLPEAYPLPFVRREGTAQ